MDRRLPRTPGIGSVPAPLADGVGQLASAGGSFVGSALAAGVDQALRTGDDNAPYRAVANMTAGLANVPARVPCTGAPRTMHCATDAPADGAARSLVGTVTGPMAGEERPISSLADGESFDLRDVPAELRDDARDYLLRHDLAWIEPCPVCDADMVRVDCPDCGGTGDKAYPFALNPDWLMVALCDRCAGTAWLMRCTGCGRYEDDPIVIAAPELL